MRPDLRKVSRGLAVVQFGTRVEASAVLFVGAVVVVFVIGSMFGSTHSHDSWARFNLALGGCGCATVLAVIGMVVATVGRMCCLETPAEWPIARSRIRLAVILDGCGLLSGLVNACLVYAANISSITMPLEVLWSVLGFSLILLVAGRVFFHTYLRSLAKALGKSTETRLSIGAVAVIVLLAFAGVLLALISYIFLGMLMVGGAVAAAWLYAYGSLLRRVREAVREFTATPVAVDEVEPD